jgi:Icc-related predicted phosphoesterase
MKKPIKQAKTKMTIVHISDTHSKHNLLHNLPAGDIIVHSGDMSYGNSTEDVEDFIEWFCKLDYKHKIFVAGNHDICFEHEDMKPIYSLPANCHYLCHSGVKIKGVKFWGVPFLSSPQKLAQIPADTDILISHEPPYGILDTTNNSYGCLDLLSVVLKIAPRYHLFGHVHGAYGIMKTRTTTFVNAALTNAGYELVNKPIVIKM